MHDFQGVAGGEPGLRVARAWDDLFVAFDGDLAAFQPQRRQQTGHRNRPVQRTGFAIQGQGDDGLHGPEYERGRGGRQGSTGKHRGSCRKGGSDPFTAASCWAWQNYRSVRHPRETRIKGWRRAWKIVLIEQFNPDWHEQYPSLVPGIGFPLSRG